LIQELDKQRVHLLGRFLCTCVATTRYQAAPLVVQLLKEIEMKWETPSYVEMRFGFEITMYIANR
jgi:coenzyme PQQ precursor peptide PqqA